MSRQAKRFQQLYTFVAQGFGVLRLSFDRVEVTTPTMMRVPSAGIEVVWYDQMPRSRYSGWVVRDRDATTGRINTLFFLTRDFDTAGAAKQFLLAVTQRLVEAKLDGVASRALRQKQANS